MFDVLDVVHVAEDANSANDNQGPTRQKTRPIPPRYLTEAGDEARMRAACALAQVMRDQRWSGRQLADWFRVDERRVREMLSGYKPIAVERLFAPEVPASVRAAIFDALKAASLEVAA